MFDESEPGKPKDWGWTIGIIITICSLNLCIFIVLRVLLDASDEFGEPLFQVATDIRKISKRWKSAYSNENFSESDVEYQTPKRTQPNPSSRQQVKFNISEDEPPLSPTTSRRMEPGRRSTQWMELKRPSLHPGEATKTSVGVKNVDYYEIPVSLVTPTAVAIIDPKFVAKTEAIDESAKKTAETATVLQNEKIENVNEQHAMFYCDSPCTSAAIAFGEKKASDSSV
ncbi:unnamed protein product [Bursaphelenchus okinawaensis]|uniref:Uncharacterized protein n=1 Tax=Bursaphelenchus okinawaensis TaxID=465554 RepID=A0A811LHZ5_9BILA|nr:unnamed protein product [Bursaphelenchus okinawaensis]CAG9123588.1 unnamed protein product [Bursaphelenchus okinawaensis]